MGYLESLCFFDEVTKVSFVKERLPVIMHLSKSWLASLLLNFRESAT